MNYAKVPVNGKIYMDYSKKIRMIRESLGLSQEALGKRIGLSGSHISRLENRKSAVTNVILEKYAEAFGVDPEWLNSEKEEDIRFTEQKIEGFTSLGDRLRK